MSDLAYLSCPKCREYAATQMSRLVPKMAARCAETGETSEQLLDRYMGGVHERHLAGDPILPGQKPTARRIASRYAAIMAAAFPAGES